MALSIYLPWDVAAGYNAADDTIASTEVADALLGFLNVDDYPLSSLDDILNTTIDSNAGDNVASSDVSDALVGFLNVEDYPLFPLEEFLDTTTDNNLFPSPTQPDNDNFQRCPKRHHYCPDNYFTPPHHEPPLFESPPIMAPPISILPPPVITEISGVNGGSISAQSMAARERRKKISDKTQLLGRLIPGGGKMNTAEMLQAAYKYVKYLQAQIAILGLTTSPKVSNDDEEENLHAMMASAAIQEKLSKEGVCLVPIKMVGELAADPLLKLNPYIEREMNTITEAHSKSTE